MDEKLRKDELARTVKFTPPLYKQRYQFVKQLVNKHKPKKVADLGCADCRLLWMLKFCNCIEMLVGLDISEDVMKEKMHMLHPLPGDYLQPSERPLTVILYQGSVAQKDPCMLGFNMVTCIELALDAAARYDYTVEFTGLGAPPPGTDDVGFCTQIGVFVRKCLKNGEPETVKQCKEHVYKTIFKAVYPSLKDEKYLQTAVVNEVVRTSQTIARKLLDNRKSKYKKVCDGVETDSPFLTSCFLKDVEYSSLTKADNTHMEPFINGQTVYVPLAKIFSASNVKQLCGTFETLSRLITGKVALSSDGSALLIDIEYENEELENEQLLPASKE